jgi:hypothetical protein
MSGYMRVERDGVQGFYARGDGEFKVVPFDALVIERSVLPEVRRIGQEIAVGGIYRTTDTEMVNRSAEEAREVGLALIALAEHLTANPPVDEELVGEVVSVLARVGISRSLDDLARSLVRAGVRVVTS